MCGAGGVKRRFSTISYGHLPLSGRQTPDPVLDMRIFAPIIILLFVISCFAQEKPTATLVDEFAHSPCDEFRARVDNFYIQLNKAPSSRGYFVVAGGNAFLDEKLGYELLMDGTIAQRQYDPGRVTKIRSTENGMIRVQMWLVPEGAIKPDLAETQWNLTLPAGTRAFVIHSGLEGICSYPTFPSQMKEYLGANPGMRVHVVVYASNSRTRKRGVRETLHDLEGIPKNRVRYFYSYVEGPDPYEDYWLVPTKKR